MIREDRELLVELKEVTTHVTDFVIGVLGSNPVDPDAQRELAERLLTVGQLLHDHTESGHIINGYVNGTIGRHHLSVDRENPAGPTESSTSVWCSGAGSGAAGDTLSRNAGRSTPTMRRDKGVFRSPS